MKKPCIKQLAFSKRSSAARPYGADTGYLPPAFLDELSCFETLRTYQGRLFGLDEHLRRLADSCAGLGRTLPIGAAGLKDWLLGAVREGGFEESIVRVSVHWSGPEEGRIIAIIRGFRPRPRGDFERGVRLRTAVGRRPPARAQNAQVKSSQYLAGVLALVDAGDAGAETLFLDSQGYVAEGSTSNIFIVTKDIQILTPPISSGILRGVTRARVMALARKKGLAVKETPFTRHELYNAAECFLTNTSSEVLPVVEVDGRRIGTGRPGPVAKSLRKGFRSG